MEIPRYDIALWRPVSILMRLCLLFSLDAPASWVATAAAARASRKCITRLDGIQLVAVASSYRTCSVVKQTRKQMTELSAHKIDVAPSVMQIMSEKCFLLLISRILTFAVHPCVNGFACGRSEYAIVLVSTKYACILRVNSFCHIVFPSLFGARCDCRRESRITYSFPSYSVLEFYCGILRCFVSKSI